MDTRRPQWKVIWIFQLFIIQVSEGFASFNGELIVRPASLVSVGTNLTIICINLLKTCSGEWDSTFIFEVNEVKRTPDWQNSTASMIQFVHIKEGYSVVCYIVCRRLRNVIDMVQLKVGYPPDRPVNIQCRVEEFSTEMICEWDTGRITGLSTRYEVHLKNLQTGGDDAKNTTVASVRFPVNVTQNETRQIQIFASNQLNQSESEIVKFHPADIVVPRPPVIRKMNSSDTNLIIYINWRNQTSENQNHCEVEYKTLKRPNWTLAGEEMNKNNVILLKKIRKADSLRVRCREKFGKRYWSNWSSPHTIPPSAPEEIPNVWRLLGPQFPNGSREITILIMPDPNDPPWINVSGYKAYYYNEGIPTGLSRCPSSGVQCAALIPKGVQMVFIIAYNPYGISPASELSLQEEDANGPHDVTVTPVNHTSMLVHWQHSASSAEPVRWYVLQWMSDSCDGKQTNILWQKTGKEQRNVTIQENVVPGQRVSISLYAVYSTGVSTPRTVYGYSQELEPKTGPSSIKIINPSLKTIMIEWAEIPLCDRRGIISGYTVHITQIPKGTYFTYDVSGSTRHFLFNKFNPEDQYSVCISASTSAGKGPTRHCTNFQQDNDFTGYIGLLVGMAFGVMVLATIIMALSGMQERVKKALNLILPKCLHSKYPDLRKSSAVKSLQADKENLVPSHNLLLLDPDIVDIEVMPKKVTSRPIPLENPARETNNGIDVEEAPLIPTAEIEVPDTTLGYRPQIANVTSQNQSSYFSPTHMLDRQITTSESGSSEIPTNDMLLLNIADDIFKGMNLTVTMGINLDDEALQSSSKPTLQSLWENQTFMDKLFMSDVPGDQDICSPSLLEEFDDTKFYFPQIYTGGL
ncbi:interleukin-23 receptor [Anomaloglossus baeobatrachus]|uniref:interleukin-23 receptor n=1 Tax=Anomaloglossus baeobatrachus TaxID=238106 RepID=UPI003F5044FB